MKATACLVIGFCLAVLLLPTQEGDSPTVSAANRAAVPTTCHLPASGLFTGP